MATGTYNGSMAPMNTSYQLKDGGNQGAVGNQDYPMENNYENEGYENYGDEAGYDGNGEYEAGAEYTGEDAGQYPEGGAYGEDGQYISGEYPPEGVRGEVPPEQMYDRGYTQGAGDGYAPGHPEQGSYYGQEGEPGYNMEDQNYGDENYDSGNYAPDGEQYDEYGENFGAEGDGAQGEGDEYEEESDEESDDEDEDDDEAEDSGGDDEDFSETLNSFEELEPTAEGSSNQSFPYEDEMKNASTSGMDAKEPTAESTPSENPPEGQKRKRKRRKKDETTGEKKEKPKRKRKKKGEKSEDGDKKKADKGARRNIRKILSENKLEQETIDAQQAELERQRRLMEIKKNLQAQQMGMVPVIPEKEVKKEKDSQLKSLLQAAEEDAEKQNDEDEKREEIKKEIKPKKEPGVIDISSAEEEEDDVVMVQSEEEDDLSDEDYAEAEDMNNSGGHINDQFNIRDDQGRVLVNLSHPTSDPDIYLSNNIAMCIKPHQIGGIRFLYDNLVECINRFKTSSGFGCILAHSMGLGKTIQMIGFIDIFLRHTGARTVMVIVPINTLANWMAEFNMWVPDKQTCEQNNMTEEDVSPRPYKTYLLNDNFKNTPARAKVIQDWYETGGVLLLGYEMYRLLSSKKVHLQKSKGRRKASGANVIDVEEEDRDKKLLHGVHEALVNPGPDLVVCDEGHRIKNSHAGISQSLKQIKTKRRIVLTGYPLQNNLIEYWCMVDFVRPNFLGNKTEFCNMFERPIMNGQCADSTPQDVRLMRYRAHVLHSLLEGFVQRRGHTVLQAALPPKQEYVFMIRMSPIQKLLYNKFMESISESGQNGWVNNNPLKAFSVCCKIWNHPDILHTCMKKRLDDNDLDIETGESKKKGGRSRGKKETPPAVPAMPSEGGAPPLPPGVPGQGPTLYLGKQSEPSITYDWANELMKDYMSGLLENGGKMMILFNLIQGSLAAGDKLLVFSQSLFTLNMVEEMLSKRKVPRDDLDEYWCKNRTYFRLDGSTPSTEREKLINQFNNDDTKWLFLLSTRAGSLGINLVGANRVVVLDASWNPCHDCQAICRVYRFGQLKPSYIYRLVTENTMERKIYDRQVNKQGMSDRVVDELNPQSQFRKEQVDKLMTYEDKDFPMVDFSQCEDTYTDVTLIDVLKRQGHWLVSKPFTHESLLIDRKELKLTMKEKRLAKQSYVMEKRLNVSYSRPSYAAYYPKGGQPPYDGMMRGRGINRPIASVKPMVSTPVPMKPKIVAAPQILKPGVSVHQVLTTTEIVLPGTNTSTEAGVSAPKKIPAGQQVLVIRTPKGVYIRTPDGKIFAVRSKPQPDSTSPLDTLANTGSNVGGVTVVRPTTTSSSSSVSKLPSGVTVIRPNTPGTSTTKPLTIIRQGPGPIRTIIPVSLGSKSPSAATTTVSSITSQMLSSASSQLQKGNATAGSNTTTMRVATPNTDGKPGVHSLTALKNLSEGKKIISNSPAFSGGSVVTKTMPKPMATVQTVKPEGLPVLSSSASDSKNESKFLGLEMAEPNEKNSIPEKSDSSWNLPPIDLKALKLPKQFNTTDNADANRLKSNNLNSVSANFKENQSEMLGTSTENSNQSTGSRPKFSLSESPSMSSMSDLSESQSSQSPKAPQMNTPPQRTYQQPGFAGCLSARPSDIDLHELNLASNPNSSQQLSQMISTDSNQLVQRLQSNQSAAFPASTSHRQAKPSQKKPRAKNSNKMHHLQQAQSNIVPKSQSRPIFNPGLPAASGTPGQMSNVGQQVHQMPVQGQNNFMDTFSGAVPGYMGTPADNTIQNTGMGYKAQAPNQNSTSDFMGLSDFGNIQNSSSFLSELNFSETDDNFLSQLGVNSDQGSQNSNEASDLNNPQAMNNFGITSSVGGSANILDTSVGMPSYQNQQQQSSMNFDNMFSSSHQPQQQQQQQQQQQPQQQQNTGFFPNFNNNHNTYGSNQNMNMSQPGGYPGGSMYPMGGMMQPGMYGYPAFPAYPYPPMMAPMPYYPMPFQPQYGGGRGGNMASPQGGNMGMGQQGQPGTSNSTLGDNNTL